MSEFEWVNENKGLVLEVLLWLFLTPILLVFGRAAVFALTHLFGSRGLWIFPNLLSDDNFFATFYPLFEWDRHPKDSLGLRWRQFRNRMRIELGMGKNQRKNRKRKISSRALRRAIGESSEN
jgi:hypothetical protein